MSVLRGNIFEKAGVNISTVFGPLFKKELKGKIPGSKNIKNFLGIGDICCSSSSITPNSSCSYEYKIYFAEKSWFGGGADITPTNLTSKQSKKLAKLFHNNFKKICESSKKGSYKTYKKWCDEYFFLPHRMEPRGLGGIFFDYLNSNNWQSDFQFTKDVGKNIYYLIQKYC